MEEHFASLTNQPCPSIEAFRPCKDNLQRLNSLDIRPDRAGDLKVVMVFSVDGLDPAGEPLTNGAKRIELEKQMWDAYRVLFTSPAAEHISNAIMTGQAPHGTKAATGCTYYSVPIIGGTLINQIIYKTRVTRATAAETDWSTMPSALTNCTVFESGGSKCKSDLWEIAILHKDYKWGDVPPGTTP